jgi:SAM-dependent methyltransferase
MMASMKERTAPPYRYLFVLVTLVGSFLLFLVQPMTARMALPLLGGAPNVWNSAMVVFQALLLGGYAYAHWLARLPFRRQAAIHLALLALSALMLPIGLADIPLPTAGWEVLWVPALFALTIGPVFLLMAAQAPLMQRWFGAAPDVGNPYALYAASNLGSFAGLLAYPLWLEPTMSLGEQSRLWTTGYLLLIVLIVLAAWSRWNVGASASELAPPDDVELPTSKRLWLWLALAAVPSGLMLSTTSLLTTDLMAMPLLWVIPLGLYLLSFSVAFTERSDWTDILTRWAPILLLSGGSLAMVSGGQANPATAIAMVGLLFVLSVALHGRLYASRPDARHLTLFYLVVAAGGALGGVFAALIAPAIFDWVYEHPILLVGAAFLLPQRALVPRLGEFWRMGNRRKAAAAAMLLVAAVLTVALAKSAERSDGSNVLVLVCVMTLLGVSVIGMRLAFAAVVVLLMVGNGGVSTLRASMQGDRTRSYFGIYSVEEVAGGKLRQLSHGTTVHGRQWLEPSQRDEPTTYYGRTAGVGIALANAPANASIGIVGLGAGTLACYRKAGQDWTFFEIDPQVLAYSRDGTFSFVRDCAPQARVVIGDARLKLAAVPDGRFDVLAIDAFSSDSIPLHLMTEEAFATYRRVLKPGGLLLVHISNRFVDLGPMVAALARASGWHGRIRSDLEVQGEGATPSVWIALARTERRIAELESASALPWAELPPPARRAWTDDNASVLPLIR